MPQQMDPLPGRLSESCRDGWRELFSYYEVEIISCALWRNRPPWALPRRRCFDSFLLFPLCGRLRATLDGSVSRFGRGEYLALADGKPHALALENGHRRLEQISLHCRIRDRWGRPLLARFRRPVVELMDAAHWYRVLTDLASLMTTDPPTGRERGKALVLGLMADRLRFGEKWAALKAGGDPRVERILRRMEEELAAPGLSVDALAREVDLTATQVRKLFRRETKLAPKKYLQQLRLRKAARLLRHSAKTVKEIAFECGFTTDNYFHLVFRQAFASTPTDFRARATL